MANEEEVKQPYVLEKVEDLIQEYLNFTLPDNCSEVQRVETRKTFIAGMYQGYALLQNLVSSVVDDAKLNECHANYVQQLEALRLEVLKDRSTPTYDNSVNTEA